jgi:pyridoxine 5-phosphate synthase
VRAITELLSEYPRVELNLEGNPFHGLVEHVEASRPAQATLVPDDSAQATSDHGWDLRADGERLRPVIHQLKSLGCRVSLFMDPVPENMSLARGLGADRIELYTESYARQFALGSAAAVTAQFRDSALAAQRAGLGVNAGHDLSLDNLGAFLKDVPGVLEVSIGHALVADALEYGLAGAVSRYLARCVTP